MKIGGSLMMVAGLLVVLIACLLPTGVSSVGFGGLSQGSEVLNLGLLQRQELAFSAGCALFVAGSVMFGAGAIVEAISSRDNRATGVDAGSAVQAPTVVPQARWHEPPFKEVATSEIANFRFAIGGAILGALLLVAFFLAGPA